MEKIIAILRDIHSNIDWENESALIDDGVLDSFDIITLVTELNSVFGIEIGLEHLEPENFNTVDAISRLLVELGAKI